MVLLLLILPLIVSFVYIPSGIGALVCLFIIYKLPRLRVLIVGAAALVATAIAGWSIWRTVSSPQSRLFGNEWFQETLHRFRFTQQEWLPSSWLTNGLLGSGPARGRGRVARPTCFELPFLQSCCTWRC